MLKVLIVDDEILIRVGLKSCIDWEHYGFDIVGLAEDGAKALDLVNEKRPDILLTDIKMPGMSGLELIRAIKEQYPKMKFVVLSCYNEMDFIKQAMKLGAEDYILKLSVQPEVLLQVMSRTREAIEKDRENEQNAKRREDELRVNKNIIKDSFYRKVLDGTITMEAFFEELRNLDVQFEPEYDIIINCRIDDYNRMLAIRPPEEQQFLILSFRNMMEEILTEYGTCELAELGQGSYLILAVNKQMRDPVHVCRKMNSAARKYLNLTLSFGISMYMRMEDHLRESYHQANCALQKKFYLGKEAIVKYDESCDFIDKQVYMDMTLETHLMNAVENQKAEEAWGLIKSFIDNLTDKGIYSPKSIRFSLIEVIHSLMKVLKKYNAQDGLYSPELNKNMADILEVETADELKALFYKFTQNLVSMLENVKLGMQRPEIFKIMSYINEHIEKSISLEEAAEICSMSKCYFSTIFKREMGEGFCDYVNRIKMEKAKELIYHFGLKSYEAAERVGIFDESYFSKLFKKYMGKNPSKLRTKV